MEEASELLEECVGVEASACGETPSHALGTGKYILDRLIAWLEISEKYRTCQILE